MKKPLWHTHTHANTHPCTRTHQTKRTAILCSTRSHILSFAMGTETIDPDKKYLLTKRHRQFTILNKMLLSTPNLCTRPWTQTHALTHPTRTPTYSYTHTRPTTQPHTNTHMTSHLLKANQSLTVHKAYLGGSNLY